MKNILLIIVFLMMFENFSAQMKDPLDWVNCEKTLDVENNKRSYDFDVYCIRSSATANVFWPGEKAEFTFQIVNNTNVSIECDAKVEIIRYGSRGIPNDVWLPEMFKIGNIQSIPVKIDIAANGFVNIDVAPGNAREAFLSAPTQITFRWTCQNGAVSDYARGKYAHNRVCHSAE